MTDDKSEKEGTFEVSIETLDGPGNDEAQEPGIPNNVYQSDLTGSESVISSELDQEVVETTKTIYRGAYWQVSITEKDQEKLDQLHLGEGSKDECDQSVRSFLMKKMRLQKDRVGGRQEV